MSLGEMRISPAWLGSKKEGLWGKKVGNHWFMNQLLIRKLILVRKNTIINNKTFTFLQETSLLVGSILTSTSGFWSEVEWKKDPGAKLFTTVQTVPFFDWILESIKKIFVLIASYLKPMLLKTMAKMDLFRL